MTLIMAYVQSLIDLRYGCKDFGHFPHLDVKHHEEGKL